jgi:hypothetical protein
MEVLVMSLLIELLMEVGVVVEQHPNVLVVVFGIGDNRFC